MAALTGSRGSTRVAAGEHALAQLEAKFGNALAGSFRESGNAGSTAALTESEARQLLSAAANADALRNRIAAERFAFNSGMVQGSLFAPEGQDVDAASVDVSAVLSPSSRPAGFSVGPATALLSQSWRTAASMSRSPLQTCPLRIVPPSSHLPRPSRQCFRGQRCSTSRNETIEAAVLESPSGRSTPMSKPSGNLDASLPPWPACVNPDAGRCACVVQGAGASLWRRFRFAAS